MRNLRFALIPAVLFLLPGLATPLFAQWGPARIIRTARDTVIPTGYNYYQYYQRTIATDSFGRIHIVWMQFPIDTSGGQPAWVYYMRSTDGGNTWEFPILLNLPGSNIGDGPSVAADGVGNVHVVWSEMFSGGGYGAIYRRSTDGGESWEPETVLVNNTYSFPAQPQLVADRKSVVHLVWGDPVLPSNEEIAYKRSSDGGVTWSRDTLLTNSPLLGKWPVSIALDSQGSPHICWYEYSFPYPGRLWFKNSSDGGLNWNPSMMFADSDTTLPGDPNIAVDGVGRVYLFFTAYCGSKPNGTWERQIVYRVSKDNGRTFGARQPLTAYPSAPNPVSVTGDLKGGVHVVYDDTIPYGQGAWLFYNGSTDGGVTWRYHPPFNLTDSFPGAWPSLTSDLTARVHLVFGSGSGGPPYTFWIIYRSGYPLGVEENRQADKETRGQREKLKATPDPFTSFAKVQGHEGERFDLYDVMGRKVGTYKGDLIGEGLAAGVYFLRKVDGSSKPLRIVKLR